MTTATKPELLTILEVPQGHYRDLSGEKLAPTIAAMLRAAAERIEGHPSTASFFRPDWYVRHQVKPSENPSTGYEWYRVEPDGTLLFYRANYDSGD
jgi:hypothetical protein